MNEVIIIKVYLRKVGWEDMDLLFTWANDRAVRENSFNIKEISYPEHKEWFNKCMDDQNVDIFILFLEDNPIGQVKLDYKDDIALISYSIDKNYRGQGYGRTAIMEIMKELMFNKPEILRVRAFVKNNNMASQRIFIENGFTIECKDNIKVSFIKDLQDQLA